MNRRVADLGEKLPGKGVEQPERRLHAARRNERAVPLVGREPLEVGLLGVPMCFPIPSEEPAELQAEREERPHGEARRGQAFQGEEREEIGDVPLGSASREVDRRHVVEGDAFEEGVDLEVECPELVR